MFEIFVSMSPGSPLPVWTSKVTTGFHDSVSNSLYTSALNNSTCFFCLVANVTSFCAYRNPSFICLPWRNHVWLGDTNPPIFFLSLSAMILKKILCTELSLSAKNSTVSPSGPGDAVQWNTEESGPKHEPLKWLITN